MIRNKSMGILNHVLILLAVFMMSSYLTGCVQAGKESATIEAGKQDGLPVDLQGKNIKQGLKTLYFFEKYRNVDDMPKSKESVVKYGRPGSPIMKLDHEFGKGNVFDSGRSTEVGVLMTGLLHFDKAGTYLFQAKSNDGFQLFIDGNLIVSDPGVHGDRLSEPGKFKVAQGGMFPVKIKYFQRKGTATLQLFWQAPGKKNYSIVPSAAYSHIDE